MIDIRKKGALEEELYIFEYNIEELLKVTNTLPPEQREIIMKFVERDELTGAFKKDRLYRDLGKMITMANRNAIPGLSLLFADIDNFKQFNDTYGHLAGDRILKGVASEIQLDLRQYDTLYRFGGEEFAITVPGTTEEQGYSVGERIRRSLERHTFEGDYKLTLSIGIAHHSGNELDETETISSLMEKADMAMYCAKKRGKNQVVVYNEREVSDARR